LKWYSQMWTSGIRFWQIYLQPHIFIMYANTFNPLTYRLHHLHLTSTALIVFKIITWSYNKFQPFTLKQARFYFLKQWHRKSLFACSCRELDGPLTRQQVSRSSTWETPTQLKASRRKPRWQQPGRRADGTVRGYLYLTNERDIYRSVPVRGSGHTAGSALL